MSGADVSLVVSVFIACSVEAVEALTIVLAVGTTRSWRSAMYGVGAALICLAVVTAALGPALTALPINVLRGVVGGFLLVFGLQWLRKAILRGSGFKALHDEEAAYKRELAAAREAGSPKEGIDAYAFLVSFKGAFLEGLEVVFIAITFGSNDRNVPLAAGAAVAAVIAVILAGAALRAPLARVPENTMKFVVGVMLTSFGMFWAAEGVHAPWPGGETALLGIVPGVLLFALANVALLRRAHALTTPKPRPVTQEA